MSIKSIYDDVCHIVWIKLRDYYEEYHCVPNYIKMPKIVCDLLRSEFNDIFIISNGFVTFYGLNICPTYSIIKIEEIEVF